MRFTHFFNHIFLALFVCTLMCVQNAHAVPYELSTWGRYKFDKENKPVCSKKNGKQLIEWLHIAKDEHVVSDYEAKQATDLLRHALTKKREQTYLMVEDIFSENMPYSPKRKRALHPRLLRDLRDGVGFLPFLSHAFSIYKLPTTNIEFRSIAAPHSMNNTPVPVMLEHLQNYENASKEATKKTGVYVEKNFLHITNLKKILIPYFRKTAWQANGEKSLEEVLASPSESTERILQDTCSNLLENRAVIEACKKDKTTLDRYLAMGGDHIINAERALMRNGWQLVARSGAGDAQAVKEEKSGKRTAVDIRKHFETLPTKQSITSKNGSLKNLLTFSSAFLRICGGVPLITNADKHLLSHPHNYKIKQGAVFNPQQFTYINQYPFLNIPPGRNTVKIRVME